MTYNNFKQKYSVDINFITYSGVRSCIRKLTKDFQIDIFDDKKQDNLPCLARLN